jgi:hypothetical protein
MRGGGNPRTKDHRPKTKDRGRGQRIHLTLALSPCGEGKGVEILKWGDWSGGLGEAALPGNEMVNDY